MLKRVFRTTARLAIVGVVLYLTRGALKRWIDGPEPTPTAPQWTPTTETPRVVPPPPVERQPTAAGTASTAAGTWVAPDGTGAAPSTHPVKVKLGSKVYREPGSSGYERCRPDRCYTSAEAAEADGFVRARR